MKILLRPINQNDHNFVFATYLRNRYFDKNNLTTLKRKTWSALQHKRLEDIFAKELVIIACLDEDPDFILGYSFIDKDKPYTYIKLSYRSEGLKLKEMLEKELINEST